MPGTRDVRIDGRPIADRLLRADNRAGVYQYTGKQRKTASRAETAPFAIFEAHVAIVPANWGVQEICTVTSSREARLLHFVILTHDHPHWHWDVMFESGGALRSWRVEGAPDSSGPLPASPLAPHRLAYLDYEGPVSGNRGEVRRWDRGTYQELPSGPEGFAAQVAGAKLNGRIQFYTDDFGQCRYDFTPHP